MLSDRGKELEGSHRERPVGSYIRPSLRSYAFGPVREVRGDLVSEEYLSRL